LAVSAEMLWPHLRWAGWSYSEDPWRPMLLFCVSAGVCLVFCRLGDAAERGASCGASMPTAGVAEQCIDSTSPGVAEAILAEKQHQRRSTRLAILLFASLTAHNIPEGFAVAVSAISGRKLGITICIAVALHNIPEGITLAVATYDATHSRVKAFLAPAAAGLAEPLGAVAALFIFREQVTQQLIDDLLVAVAGVMCCIALAELIPEAVSTKRWGWASAGLLLGLLVMYVTHLVLD